MSDDFDGGTMDGVDTSPDISDISSDVDNDVSDNIPADIPEDVRDSSADEISDGGSTDIAEDIAEDSSKESSIDIPEDIPDDVSEDVPVDTSGDIAQGSNEDQQEEQLNGSDEVDEDVANISKDDELPNEQSGKTQNEELTQRDAEEPSDPSMEEPGELSSEDAELSAEGKEPLAEQIEKEALLRDDIKDNPEFVDENGAPKFPEPYGFEGEPQNKTTQPGEMVDRYGPETGFFTSPQGTPYEERSLPYDKASQEYNVYEVVNPVDVLEGPTAAAFNQDGGGTQQMWPEPIENLVDKGDLKWVAHHNKGDR